jgi:putative ABC transport system permease protein
MSDTRFFKFASLYALRSIGRNRRRTMLTIGTIALSTAVSIVGSCYSTAVLQIWEDGVIDHGAGHAQFHTKGYWAQQETLLIENTFQSDNKIEPSLKNDDRVEAYARRLKFEGVISAGSKSVFFFGRGVDPKVELKVAPDTFNPDADLGSFISDDQKMGVVIGKGLAETLEIGLGDEASLMVNTLEGSINGVDVKVRGIMDNPIPALSKRLLYMHVASAQKSIWVKDRYTEIAVRLKSNVNAEDWVSANESLAKNGSMDLRGWWKIDPYVRKVQKIWDSVIGVISFLLFVSAGIGVLNIVFMLVAERTVEIGTLMAIGAKPSDIKFLFTLEAAIFGLFGGIIGALIGNITVVLMDIIGITFASPFGSGEFQMHPSISPLVTAIVMLGSIIICYISALVPSRKAASVEPVTAFRGQMT